MNSLPAILLLFWFPDGTDTGTAHFAENIPLPALSEIAWRADTLHTEKAPPGHILMDEASSDTLYREEPPPEIHSSDEPADTLREKKMSITPLSISYPSSYHKISNDSLSRWELWSGSGEWLSRQPGVIAFQLGGLGRNDGFLIRGHEHRHQRTFRDGIPLNERLFGSANRMRLPHYSRMAAIYEGSGYTRSRHEITTRQYHVSKPLTLVNYEQTSNDYRNTEGFLTRNFSPATNLSLYYQGKNEEAAYRNSGMDGRNAGIGFHHYLTPNWLTEGGWHYAGTEQGEPGGYRIPDMFTFPFDRFAATPYQPTANSTMRNSLFYLTAYQRKKESADVSSQFSLYYDRYRRQFEGVSDSSYVRTISSGLSARHTQKQGFLKLQGNILAEGVRLDKDRFDSMEKEGWIYSKGRLNTTLYLPFDFQLGSWVEADWRSDGYTGFEAGGRFKWYPSHYFSLYGSYAEGSQMPLPGFLYWQRQTVKGNRQLENERIRRAETGFRFKKNSWSFGGEAYASLYDEPILLQSDTMFVNAGAYTSAGATGWLKRDTRRYEFLLSLTFQQYFSDGYRIENQMLDKSGQRLWSRASFYYKNYIYNKAAFMKAGFYLQVSPTLYRTYQYYPEIDYWDPNSWNPEAGINEGQALPEFFRLDLEMTARVRSAFFLLRMENALDSWLVPGYFESAYYPMPSRRFRFGIRWVLRN